MVDQELNDKKKTNYSCIYFINSKVLKSYCISDNEIMLVANYKCNHQIADISIRKNNSKFNYCFLIDVSCVGTLHMYFVRTGACSKANV